MRPDTDYDACLICQKGTYSHSRLVQKLTNQSNPALLYAITNRKDEISFRIRLAPTQTFWKRIWSVSNTIAPSTLTAKLLTREKASLRNKKTLSCKCDQFYVDNFSLPVYLAATRVVPIPFPRALTRSADLAFALSICSPSPVEGPCTAVCACNIA